MRATGRAGELADYYHPHPWSLVEWLRCDLCDSELYVARSEAGHLGQWSVCAEEQCRRLYRLSVEAGDVVGTWDGELPLAFHRHLTT